MCSSRAIVRARPYRDLFTISQREDLRLRVHIDPARAQPEPLQKLGELFLVDAQQAPRLGPRDPAGDRLGFGLDLGVSPGPGRPVSAWLSTIAAQARTPSGLLPAPPVLPVFLEVGLTGRGLNRFPVFSRRA